MKQGFAAIASLALAGALVAALGTPVGAQQHSYTQAQIDDGRQLYEANCGRCHGARGSEVPGVELFKQIRRATSDDDIAALIQRGIPGTAMPPHQISSNQALNVVAFLRAMVNAAPIAAPNVGRSAVPALNLTLANASRGKSLFGGKAACATCHRAEGAGGTTGPDLSAIGAPRIGIFFGNLPIDAPSLERSMLDPNDEIALAYRVYQVTPNSGAPIRGELLNQDTFSIQVLETGGGLRSLMKSDLKEFGYLPSPMPSYRGKLSDDELADIVAYLLTLKGSTR